MEKKPLQTWPHFIISDNIENPRESSHLKQDGQNLQLSCRLEAMQSRACARSAAQAFMAI